MTTIVPVKFIVSVSCVLIFATCAVAEWTTIQNYEYVSYYVEKETINKSGSIVSMWVLESHKWSLNYRNGKVYRSTKWLKRYDCQNKLRTIRQFIHYSDRMANGVPVVDHIYEKEDWKPIVNGSLGERSWRIACEVG